jgi:hypothetical protein
MSAQPAASTDASVIDTNAIESNLEENGYAIIPRLFDPAACDAFAASFDRDELFRSTIDMARYRFGRGHYRYFNYPLPSSIQQLREAMYSRLAPIANRWAALLGESDFPLHHRDLIEQCRAAEQLRPTPLLLRYRAGDYNCLHQDLYGPRVFPLQLVCLLSEPGTDFEGGELVLTEQRPRAQSRAHVVKLHQGDAAVIATHHFPRAGTRGYYRAQMRHGVGTLHHGERFALGVIFHDAA